MRWRNKLKGGKCGVLTMVDVIRHNEKIPERCRVLGS